jgi:hypothetical protein
MKGNKKTKTVRSARRKLFDSDAYMDVLDAALTSAEQELKALLPMLKPSKITEAFAIHVHTHLSTELSNIAAHGHRNDDPEDLPSTDQDSDNWRVEDRRYVVSSDDVLIADCYADSAMDFGLPEPSEYRANARLIAKSPQMATFVNLVARMKTEEEFGNNAPPSEDWISTLNDLIAEARKIARL